MSTQIRVAPGRAVLSRTWQATIAVLVTGGMVLQLLITVRASATPAGHAVGTLAGAPLPTRIVRVLSFFTLQSNLLCAVTSAQLARRPDRDGVLWRPVRIAALIGITVTGIVYSTVLARVHEPHGWEQVANNAVFHYVVPVMMLAGWLLLGPRPRVDLRSLAGAALWPVGWLTYSLAHGAASGWYPYPFLDAGSFGYARVLLNALAVLLVLATAAALLRLGDRALPTTS